MKTKILFQLKGYVKVAFQKKKRAVKDLDMIVFLYQGDLIKLLLNLELLKKIK